MSRAWSQHPNARYLDWILHDYLEHSEFWYSDLDWLTFDRLFNTVSQNPHHLTMWLEFRRTLYHPVRRMAEPRMALGVSAALVAWPETSDLFYVPADQIAVLARLGQPGAMAMEHVVPVLHRFHEYQQLIHG